MSVRTTYLRCLFKIDSPNPQRQRAPPKMYPHQQSYEELVAEINPFGRFFVLVRMERFWLGGFFGRSLSGLKCVIADKAKEL